MDHEVPAPLLSSHPAVNHVTMFDAFRQAFDLSWESMQWPEADRPVLVQDFPVSREGQFDHKFDVILYHLVHSEIASTSNDGLRKPKGYWNFQRFVHPTKARYSIVKSGWQETVTVQFTVYAKSNQRANELVDWFHRMVLLYAHGMKFFQARGINELRFHQRLEDKHTKDYGQELFMRPLQYLLRLELGDTAEVKNLEMLHVDVAGTGTDLK